MSFVSELLKSPFYELLISIPLCVFGNLTTDFVKKIAKNVMSQDKMSSLEELFFNSFLKALELHHKRHDSVAKKITSDVMSTLKSQKQDFIFLLKKSEIESAVMGDFSQGEEIAKRLVDESLLKLLGDKFDQDQAGLVRAIMKDTCSYYREAFFNEITSDQQLWLVFKESCKIESIREIVCELQKNLPNRDEFECIRNYILSKEITPQKIEELKTEYLSYLERKYSSVELKGVSPRVQGQDISFKLDDIFIPLEISSKEGRKRDCYLSGKNNYLKFYNLDFAFRRPCFDNLKTREIV